MTMLLCDQAHDLYMCTLALGHDGPHAAFGFDSDVPEHSWGWSS